MSSAGRSNCRWAVFFPALLLAVVEWSAECAGRSRSLSPRSILPWLCVATAVVFALTKTTAAGNEAYRVGLGVLQWPFSAVHSLFLDGSLPPLRRVSLLRDPWDLLAVPFAFVSWALCAPARTQGTSASPPSSRHVPASGGESDASLASGVGEKSQNSVSHPSMYPSPRGA